MKSPTGLYCANSQKRTESLLLPSSPTIQADLSANAVFRPLKIHWLYCYFADKSAPTEFAARQRYVEDVMAPPTIECLWL